MLFFNSRITNRELSRKLNISPSAVHKRIKAMETEKIIQRYIARPSILALNSIPVVIIGRSSATDLSQMIKDLGAVEQVFAVAMGSANIMYVSVMLRSIAEMQEVSSLIDKKGMLTDTLVGIVTEPYSKIPISLSKMELSIIKSLNKDARKSVNEVATELNVSAKTIKRHLIKMEDENKVNFTIEWAPLHHDSFITVFHIHTAQNVDVNKKVKELYLRYKSNTIICVAFSNIPNFILFEIWSKSPRISQIILEELQKEFEQVVPHVLMNILWFRSWMDTMLEN